ncbi:PREDICTED: histone deacetylase HDT1 isoform X2 [Prunus mume]|uniref:Histone deacetylase HDT1 isoform X2 n=1 Tax=Prunus mume TaxID=102107 RepID=A0ABM0PLE4_PRUMU|nr:PREDICTED: histone deacetylase HDT1 isoform X2 [Prunus mume]
MEFWGVEVKSGQSVSVEPKNKVVHLSQVCLDDVKKAKGSNPISLFVKTGNHKLVLGILSAEKFPQLPLDIFFGEKFELSHNWKNGSVHFIGYKSLSKGDNSDSEEDVALTVVDNGKPVISGKPKLSTEDTKKAIKSEQKEASSDDDESDDEEVGADQTKVKFEEGSSEDEDESDDDDADSEDETDDSEEEDEETPKKADVSKKRPAESAKILANNKKAKFVTPEKTDSKKGSVHIATPYPAKLAGKKPATSDQSKQQAPKSGGTFNCQSCNRSFNSDVALQSHTKAKHSAAK